MALALRLAPDAEQRLPGRMDPELGAVRMTAATPRLTATPAAVRWAGPPLGAHNAEVYGALGISGAELEHLERDGIV